MPKFMVDLWKFLKVIERSQIENKAEQQWRRIQKMK
jgi:hypothetical protein